MDGCRKSQGDSHQINHLQQSYITKHNKYWRTTVTGTLGLSHKIPQELQIYLYVGNWSISEILYPLLSQVIHSYLSTIFCFLISRAQFSLGGGGGEGDRGSWGPSLFYCCHDGWNSLKYASYWIFLKFCMYL